MGGDILQGLQQLVALKTTAQVQKLPFEMETFTIMLDELKNDSAQLIFAWEDTAANLKIDVPTDEMAMSSIQKIMNGPSAGDYFAAATYYHDEKKDLQQAYDWIKKAVEMGNPNAYWVLRRKALIEADLGKKAEAIETAKKSMAAAEKAGNQDYVKMNKDSIEEWGGK
jgi:tetratricopeptide (TPR) repeat protein